MVEKDKAKSNIQKALDKVRQSKGGTTGGTTGDAGVKGFKSSSKSSSSSGTSIRSSKGSSGVSPDSTQAQIAQRKRAEQVVGGVTRIVRDKKTGEIRFVGPRGEFIGKESGRTFTPEEDREIRGGSSRIEQIERSIQQEARRRQEETTTKIQKRQQEVGTKTGRIKALTEKIEQKKGRDREVTVGPEGERIIIAPREAIVDITKDTPTIRESRRLAEIETEKRKSLKLIGDIKETLQTKKNLPLSNFFSSLVSAGGKISQKTGFETKILGEEGTGEPLVSGTIGAGKKVISAFSDIGNFIFSKSEELKIKAKPFFRIRDDTIREGNLLVSGDSSKVSFSKAIDTSYSESLENLEKKGRESGFIKKDSGQEFVIRGLKGIKPSFLITEGLVASATGTLAVTLIRKSQKILSFLKIISSVVTTGFVGATGLELFLAPEEKRPSILFQRGSELIVGAAGFKFGLKKGNLGIKEFNVNIKEMRFNSFKRRISSGIPFDSGKKSSVFLSQKVSEIRIDKKGRIKRIIDTLEFKQKRPGIDVQRFLFEPAKERQLLLIKDKPNLKFRPVEIAEIDIETPSPNIRKDLFLSTVRKLRLEKTRNLLKFGARRPLRPSESFLLRNINTKKIIPEKQLTLFARTESGQPVSRFGKINLDDIDDSFNFKRKSLLRKLFESKRASAFRITKFKRDINIIDFPESRFKTESALSKSSINNIRNINIQMTKGILFTIARLDIKIKEREKQKQETNIAIDFPESRFKIGSALSKISQNIYPSFNIDIKQDDTSIKSERELRQDQKDIQAQDDREILTPILTLDIPFPDKPKIPNIRKPPKPEEQIIIPKFNIPKLPTRRKIKENKGYDSFAKSKGKFIKLNKKPLPENKAFNLMQEVLDNTASATGKIKETKEKTNIRDSFFRQGEFKLRKKGNLYIEKNRYRIDSPGERKEITVKGYLSRKNSNKFF